jgi:sec-independent protein translocase protein TatA
MFTSFDILAFMPGPMELAIIAGIALLLFGRRLPEVAKSMGRSIVEFKKGLKDVKDDIDTASSSVDDQKALPANDDTNKDKSSA